MSPEESQTPEGGTIDLRSKVKKWLNQEGYPTEFTAASVFRRHEFRVHQGYYVRAEDSDAVREIDILASKTASSRDYLIRAYYVVECKLSQDKPWVVLTSANARIGHAACVAQTMGSLLGSTILWAIAGDKSLHNMDLFSTPDRPGFNGRQAFSKGKDYFYSAMQSVTTVASLAMRQYDPVERPKGNMPGNAVVAFPVIVVDGQLFEAFYDADEADVRVEGVKRVRCHWRGASSWDLHATIDIVTLDHLEEFIAKRANELESLLPQMEKTRNQIAECFKQRTLDPLTVPRASRGLVGLPRLLREALPDKEKFTDPGAS